MIPVEVDGVRVSALVDSGCGQTLIRQDLIKTPGLPEGMIHVQCIHGDVKPYHSNLGTVMVNGETSVGLASKLAYPIILGHDRRGFAKVLHAASPESNCPESAIERDLLEGEGETPTDPGTRSGEHQDSELDTLDEEATPRQPSSEEMWNLGASFAQDQWEDPTLSQTYKQVTSINGESHGTSPGRKVPPV